MIPSPDEWIDDANERALERQGYNHEDDTIACANEHCGKRVPIGQCVPMGPQGLTGPYYCQDCADGISEAQANGIY